MNAVTETEITISEVREKLQVFLKLCMPEKPHAKTWNEVVYPIADLVTYVSQLYHVERGLV